MTLYLKDPNASIDYAIDWGAAYLSGQQITTSSWRVEPVAPLGVQVTGSFHDATRTSVTLAGGEPGSMYRIVNRVTLSDGRSDERSLSLRVDAR